MWVHKPDGSKQGETARHREAEKSGQSESVTRRHQDEGLLEADTATPERTCCGVSGLNGREASETSTATMIC